MGAEPIKNQSVGAGVPAWGPSGSICYITWPVDYLTAEGLRSSIILYVCSWGLVSPSTFYILYVVFYILHSTFYILYVVFYILHSIFYILYVVLYSMCCMCHIVFSAYPWYMLCVLCDLLSLRNHCLCCHSDRSPWCGRVHSSPAAARGEDSAGIHLV